MFYCLMTCYMDSRLSSHLQIVSIISSQLYYSLLLSQLQFQLQYLVFETKQILVRLEYGKLVLFLFLFLFYYLSFSYISILIPCQIWNMPGRGNHLWENYRSHWKSMGILSNICRYRFWMTLALADILHLYML